MSGYELALQIAGGVALLLWATRMVRTGIERAYGAQLRRVLARAAHHRLGGVLAGFAVTAILQSSTATALLTTAFAANGLIAAAPALAIMLGADLGSTFVVQLLSFDLAWLSPALLLVGVCLFLAGRARQARQLGRILIGLGLMLLALQLIVHSSDPLRASTALPAVIGYFAEDLVTACLLAALLTWLAHSSVAMILLIMSLAAAGLIPLPLACSLVLGANLGAGLIPFFLTLRGEPEPRRIPLGNLLFRLAGVALALAVLVNLPLPLAELGADPARQIANFHSLFNLGLVLLFLPLTTPMARLAARLLPRREQPAAASESWANPSHLDEDAIGTPRLAIAGATREVLRMADRVEAMLRHSIDLFLADGAAQRERLTRIDDEVDATHAALKLYLAKVARNRLEPDQARRCRELNAFAIKLEHIGDIIVKNLAKLAEKKAAHRLEFSPQGWQELTDLHALVVANLQLALNVFISGDRETARLLVEEKDRVRKLELDSSERHLVRLQSGQLASIQTSSIHLDAIRDLKQINSLLAAVAYPILQNSGDLLRSRLAASGSAANG